MCPLRRLPCQWTKSLTELSSHILGSAGQFLELLEGDALDVRELLELQSGLNRFISWSQVHYEEGIRWRGRIGTYAFFLYRVDTRSEYDGGKERILCVPEWVSNLFLHCDHVLLGLGQVERLGGRDDDVDVIVDGSLPSARHVAHHAHRGRAGLEW